MKNKISLKNRFLDKSINVDDYIIVASSGLDKIEILSNLSHMEMLTLLMPLLHEIDLTMNKFDECF